MGNDGSIGREALPLSANLPTVMRVVVGNFRRSCEKSSFDVRSIPLWAMRVLTLST
jgi:hypothetical protein